MINYVNADSLTYLKNIKDNSVKLILTDPPYGINFHGKYDPDSKWDCFAENEFFNFNALWMKECYRILSDDGSFWCFCGPTKRNIIIEAAESVGFIFHIENWKSIQRQKGRGSKNKPKSLREDILHFSKSDNYLIKDIGNPFNSDTTTCTNMLNLSTGKVERPQFNINDKIFYFKMPYYLSKTEKMIHSTQKSVLLLSAIVLACSDKNDTVVDPFMGSGSCGIACNILDRDFIGIEKDNEMKIKAECWLKSFDREAYLKEFFKNGVI